MNSHTTVVKFFMFGCSMLLATACLLPNLLPRESVPTVPAPVVETDPDKFSETLNGSDWVYLQSIAEETYTEKQYETPGTLNFTVTITEDKPTYFNYGWCATTEEILKQNLEHITVDLYFNDQRLSDELRPYSFTRSDGLSCLDFGVLFSSWPNGHYTVRSAAKFDEVINDGLAEYQPGDYIMQYDVAVRKDASP